MSHQKILILDFGGSYTQLVARSVRKQNVFCEVLPYSTAISAIEAGGYCGIILSGGSKSVNAPESLLIDNAILSLNVPVLGIAYGMHLLAKISGGQVSFGGESAVGSHVVEFGEGSDLMAGLGAASTCVFGHPDCVGQAEGFTVTACSKECKVAGFEDAKRHLYGVQFHPEVDETECGADIIRNFLFNVCGCRGDWSMDAYIDSQVEQIRRTAGGGKVLCALSGGVDSSVSAVMVHKAVGDALHCIFVDHGLLRKNEADEVEKVFREQFKINFVRVDAADRFVSKLAGVTDPERKRKIVGEEFIRVFEEEARKLGQVDYFVQGTIYPDIIESGIGDHKVVKSHHNVGGLPDIIDFKEIIEPVRMLFKDEVREAGRLMGIPEEIVARQPFPGPGLCVRVIGEVTHERLDLLRDADAIVRHEIIKNGLHKQISQYFAVLTDMKSVGVRSGERTYESTIALRAIKTTDFMTANWSRIPYDVLETISSRIVNEVCGVNRVVFDITTKPPSTIEWE